MSFGVSVSDILNLLQVVSRLQRDIKSAPGQFKAAYNDLQSLSAILKHNTLYEESLTTEQRASLDKIMQECKSVIAELDETLIKFRGLKNPGSKSLVKRVQTGWKRIKWRSEQVRELRTRIILNITLLNAFSHQLIKNDLAVLAQGQQTRQREAISSWLKSYNYGRQHIDIRSQRCEGTTRWILETPEFQEWLKNGKQTLACLGIPGAGKSVVTSIILDFIHFKAKRDNSIGFTYIYCDYRQQGTSKFENVLLTLLRRLTAPLSTFPQIIIDLYDHYSLNETRPSSVEVFKALEAAARSYARVFIVIDGLDEYESAQGPRTQFLKKILDLQSKIGADLFVTSRSNEDILRRSLTKVQCLTIRATNEDLYTYIDSQIQTHLHDILPKNDRLRLQVKKDVTRAAAGMFLFAQLQMAEISKLPTRGEIKHELRKLGAGEVSVETLYDQTMQRIKSQGNASQNLAIHTLAWVSQARWPISTVEIRHALAIRCDQMRLDEDFIPRLKDLLYICKGLITVDHGSNKLRLSHGTVQEYLHQTQTQWFPNVQIELGMACINYLSFECFNASMSELDDDAFKKMLKQYPFYEHAARNWGYYAKSAEIKLKDSIFRLLGDLSKVSVASRAMLFCKGWRDSNQSGASGAQALHLAAHFGLGYITKSLLEDGHHPDSKTSDGQTPMLWATRRGEEEVVLLLLENHVDTSVCDEYRRTVLHYAAVHGWTKSLDLLLRQGADIEARDFQTQTPLLVAAGREHAGETVHHLIQAGANARVLDCQGRGPLHLALDHPHAKLETIKLLLSRDAPTNVTDVQNMTPLHYAIRHHRWDSAKLLIEHGVPIDIGVQRRTWNRQVQDGYEVFTSNGVNEITNDRSGRIIGLTPLHHAVVLGRSTMTHLLLERGADPNALSHDGQSPLHVALRHGLPCLRSADFDGWADDCYAVEAILDFLDDLEEAEAEEIVADIAMTRMEVALALLNHPGIDVRIQDADGDSALHCVRYGKKGSATLVSELIEKGADVHARNLKQKTALHLACLEGDYDSVNILLRHGANIFFPDDNGSNALHYAARSRSNPIETLSHILQAIGPETTELLRSVDRNGRNALHYLLFEEASHETDAIQLLLDHGLNIRETDSSGKCPLAFYLSDWKLMVDADVCRYMLQKGSDARFVTNNGQTLAHLYADCWEANVQVLEHLMEYGVDMNAVDSERKTLLHHIALSGCLTENVMQWLLANTTLRVDAQDLLGKTAVEYASERADKIARECHPDMFDPDCWARTADILIRASSLNTNESQIVRLTAAA